MWHAHTPSSGSNEPGPPRAPSGPAAPGLSKRGDSESLPAGGPLQWPGHGPSLSLRLGRAQTEPRPGPGGLGTLNLKEPQRPRLRPRARGPGPSVPPPAGIPTTGGPGPRPSQPPPASAPLWHWQGRAAGGAAAAAARRRASGGGCPSTTSSSGLSRLLAMWETPFSAHFRRSTPDGRRCRPKGRGSRCEAARAATPSRFGGQVREDVLKCTIAPGFGREGDPSPPSFSPRFIPPG
jgi:hypothetical protein